MKLLIADDHTLFRDTLVQYVERAKPGSQIFTAKNFDEAYELAEREKEFDLVLLDLRMPGMHGLSGLEKLHKRNPGIRVAIMSGLAEKEDVTAAMDMGAAGYFPKTLSGQALMKAIELVLAGERFMPLDHHTNTIMPSYRHDPATPLSKTASLGKLSQNNEAIGSGSASRLTPREREVLQHLARGESNKEIARSLELQVVTVKLHVRGICKKLDAANRTQAALKAQEMGITSVQTHHG